MTDVIGSVEPLSPWAAIAQSRRSDLRELVESSIAPLVEAAEATQVFPVEVYRLLGEAGFLAIGAPASEGGEGGGRTSEVMVVQELARAGAGITMSVVPFFIVRIAVFEFGSPEAIEEVGKPMMRGERIVGICMSEPDAGSDVASIRTRAVPDGDGWRISGSKMFITNGTIATDLLVVAKTSDGIGLFLLDTNQPGYTARKLDKESARASDTTEIEFDEVYVPAHRVVGDPHDGFRKAMRVLNGERILSCARAIQLARDSWDDAVAWASQSTISGEPALATQGFQGPLAAALGDLWLLDLGLEKACLLWDRGDAAVSEISMLKTLSTKKSVEITRLAQTLTGVDGVRAGTRLARNARDTRLGTVTAGSEQIMHRILARQSGWPKAKW
ncbi:MAG: acyl-CoA/acyl-ACP dehydrogenase [Cryobacterium sp.]|nr:acyl-CoA/acyl-ACP dehydrogenase [Cryobacterium sp.]